MQPRRHEDTKTRRRLFGTQSPLSPKRRFLGHAAIALTDDHRRARRKRRGEANRFDAAVPATTACYAGRSASNQILRVFVPSWFVFFVVSWSRGCLCDRDRRVRIIGTP